MNHDHMPYWLAALYLPGASPRKFLRWLEHFADIEKFFTASPDELFAAGLSLANIEAVRHPDWQSVERDIAWSKLPDNHLIALNDVEYPGLLKEITDPPLVLYVRGNLAALASAQIAIVGARGASPTGLKNAEHFAFALARSGFAITSGLALGVDGASHRGALKARGITIGVCGTGLHHIYPRSHRTLVEEITSNNGAIISEFTLPVIPMAANFPRRNRIIGGLSRGVLVVEAAMKSGCINHGPACA